MSTTPTEPTFLDELATTAGAVAAAVGPSLVTIGRNGRGTGLVVGSGRVLTNAHNLRDRTTQVAFADGRVAQAELTGSDDHGDLVVLEADTAELPTVTWSPLPPAVGTPIFALARPLRGERLSFGLVSGVDRTFRGPRGRRITGGLEHSAPLGRGASGGPVVDRHGAVVAINTHRLGDGFYLARPADPALVEDVRRMSEGEDVRRPTLGVAVAPPEVASRLRRSVGLDERVGVLVREVDPEGPAGRAGVREGDLLVAAGGRPLEAVPVLFEVLDGHDPTGELVLSVVRGADELELAVRFDT